MSQHMDETRHREGRTDPWCERASGTARRQPRRNQRLLPGADDNTNPTGTFKMSDKTWCINFLTDSQPQLEREAWKWQASARRGCPVPALPQGLPADGEPRGEGGWRDGRSVASSFWWE